MRSRLLFSLLLCSIAITLTAQDWQTIRYVDFENGSGSQNDFEAEDTRYVLTGPYAPILGYGNYSMTFLASDANTYVLNGHVPIGYRLDLSPNYEYRFSLNLETWSGHDIGFYLIAPDQSETLINGPVTTQQRDPSWTPGNVDPRELYTMGWNNYRTSDVFTVPTAGEYYICVKHFSTGTNYTNLPENVDMYDIYDNLLFQSRYLDNPTKVYFQEAFITAAEGTSVELCVDIENPSATEATEVDITLFSTPDPHFEDFEPAYLTFPAGSSEQQCTTLSIPVTQENAPSTFYDFVLQNGVNSHEVLIEEPSTATIEVTQSNTLSLSSPNELVVEEGSSVEICVALQSPSSSFTTVDLEIVGSASPHFVGNEAIFFAIPPLTTSHCETISIPSTSNNSSFQYQWNLQDINGTDVVIASPSSLSMTVNPAQDPNCWEEVLYEPFSSSDNSNFSNLPHIVTQGFSRSTYGASGQSSDACARATTLSSSYYVGLLTDLVAGQIYRLSWNGKSSSTAKSLDLYIGTSSANLTYENGPYAVPVVSISSPGVDIESGTFSVSSSGQYYLVLKKSASSSSSGYIRIDNLKLENNCGQTVATALSFVEDQLSVNEGYTVDICTQIAYPSSNGSSSVEVALAGTATPHLGAYTVETLSFPAGSGANQCFTLSVPANGALDGDHTYEFILQNATSSGSIEIADPDTLTLTIIDDLTPADCNNWSTLGSTIIFDNYTSGILPADFLHNSGSFMETVHPDHPGDRSFFGVYGTDFYLGIPFELDPAYEYRIQWHTKGFRYGSSYNLPTKVAVGTSYATAVDLDGEFDANQTNTSAVFQPISPGTYYFFIKGADFINQSDIFLDDISLEGRCLQTEVSFFSDQSAIQLTEGEMAQVCLQIANPSHLQNTEATISFTDEAAPHFAEAASQYTVTFPAGSSAPACVSIPSSIFQGADTRSEYRMQIDAVSGGIHPLVVEPSQKLVQVLESNNCWDQMQFQQFNSVDYYVNNILDWIDNNSAFRAYYGASGTSSDRCVQMRLNGNTKYLGFRKYLHSGVQYRAHWNLKAVSEEKEVYLAVGQFAGSEEQVGESRIIPIIADTDPGQALTFEYFTVPIDGYYNVVLKSDNNSATYLKFDDFRLEERCPPVRLSFTSDKTTIEEGLPVEVCVAIENPSASESTSVEIGFLGSQSPHFANSGPQSVYFAPGETSPQCVVFSSIGNQAYDETLPTYQLRLRNPFNEFGAELGDISLMEIILTDDVDLSNCEWAGPDQRICLGDTVQIGIDYSEMALYEDCANAAYCFRWEPALEVLLDGQYQQMPLVSPTESTWFEVFMTDGQGNLFVDSVYVEVDNGPDFSFDMPDQHVCPGDTLELTVNITEGSGNYGYLWSTGATTPSIQVDEPGTYALSVTDLTLGCTFSQQVIISEPELSYTISSSGDFICTNTPSASLDIPGIDPNLYTFIWSSGGTGPSTTVSTGGMHSVTITDNTYGCDTVLSHQVFDIEQDLALSIAATDSVRCENDTLQLTAVIAGLPDGMPNVSYLWSDDQATPGIEVWQAGTYSVTVSLGGSCELVASTTITDAHLEFTVVGEDGEDFACPERPLVLSTTSADSSNIVSWNWSTGESSPTISVSAAGTYSVTLTDQDGCPHEQSFTVEGCPTVVYFTEELVQVLDDETAQVCVELVNPGATATTVDVVFNDAQDPHFVAAPTSQTVSFAPGETSVCLEYIPQEDDSADSVTVYNLQLINVSGGTDATIGQQRETMIAVESMVRCQVQQDSLPVNCELSDTSTIVSDVPLITRLEKDDSFWAGDFEVKVTDVQGNGVFNGQGVIKVPYFNDVLINVELDQVEINEDCQMVAGEVKVLGVGADLLSDELANALDDLLGTLDDIEDVITVIDEVLTTIEDVVNSSSQVGNVLSEDWNLLHGADPIFEEYPYLPDSLSTEIEEAILCYLVNPPSVCSEQLAETIQNVIAAINELFTADYAIRFQAHPEQVHGFDSLMYSAMADDYNYLTVAGQPYHVAWKSVVSNGSDEVLVDRAFTDLPPDLTFENNSTAIVPHSNYFGQTKLPIQGRAHEETYQIYPVQTKVDTAGNETKKYAGKLNVISYDEEVVDVVLVPVNGAIVLTEQDRTQILDELNEIYKPAITSFNLELQADLQVQSFDGMLDTTGSAFYTLYNSEMRSIYRTYKQERNQENDKYYIFLVPGFTGDQVQGFMPRGREFGFVATGSNSNITSLSRTIAHELGHGAFLLQHTFEEYNLGVGETANLMDYGSGTILNKYQWDLIHNPPLVISILDDDQSNQQATLLIKEYLEDYVLDNGYITFVSNKGQPIHLEYDRIASLTFATGGEIYDTYDEELAFIPVGSLTYFEILTDQQQTTRYWNCADGQYWSGYEPGTTGCGGELYQNPDISNTTSIRPLVLRHGRDESSDILHFAEIVDTARLSLDHLGDILNFDYFIDDFFDLETQTVKSPSNVIPVNDDTAILDEAFGLDVYQEFIASNAEEAEYTNLSSFYLSGLAVLIKTLSDNYNESCADDVAFVKSVLFHRSSMRIVNGVRNAITDIGDFVNGSNSGNIENTIGTAVLSKTESMLSGIYSAGYYDQSGLSKTELARQVLRLIYRSDRVERFNQLIVEMDGDPVKADKIIQGFFSDFGYLLPCEYDGLEFPNYEDLQLLIQRLYVNTHFDKSPHDIVYTTNDQGEIVSISRYEETFNVNNEEEWVMLKLMRKILPENYQEFLHFLDSQNEETQSYYWDQMIDGIDNRLFERNGYLFLSFLMDAYEHILTNHPEDPYRQSFDALANQIIITEASAADPDLVDTELHNINPLPIVPYNYTAFLNRIDYWEAACRISPLLFFFCDYDSPVFPPTPITDVVAENGQLTIYQRNKLLFLGVDPPEGSTGLPLTVHPFDPVIIDKSSSFGEATAVGGMGTNVFDYSVVPAIALYYLEEEASNTTATDIITTGIDIGTLFFPIPKIGTISRMLAYTDKASSILSIAGTYAQGESPNSTIAQSLNLASAFLGVASLTDIAFSSNAATIRSIMGNMRKSYVLAINSQEQATRFMEMIDFIIAPANRSLIADAPADVKRALERLIDGRLDDLLVEQPGIIRQLDVDDALSILRTGLTDIEHSIRQALIQANAPNAEQSLLPAYIVNGLERSEAEELTAILLAENNTSLLIQFHLSFDQYGLQNNFVAAWKAMHAQELDEAEELVFLRRFAEDLQHYESNTLLAVFNLDGNAPLWVKLNTVPNSAGEVAEQTALLDGLEEMWIHSIPGFSFLPVENADIFQVKHLENVIADLTDQGVSFRQYDTQGYLASGSEVVYISVRGNFAILHVPATGSCIRTGACFPAGTPVHTPDGLRPIEDLRAQDQVYAYDEINQDTVISTVKQHITKAWSKMVNIVVGNDTITATNNHPFYIPSLRRYLPADSLRANMKLLALTGALLTVQSTFATENLQSVYNIEVVEHHNYFVGDLGVLVHNDKCFLNAAGLKSSPSDPGEAIDLIEDTFPDDIATADNVRRTINERLNHLEKNNPTAYQELVDYFRAGHDGIDAPAEIIELRKNRVRAWEKVRHLPEDIKYSVPQLQNISDILSSNLPRIEKTNLIEAKIANSNYEHGAILDSDGSLLAFRVGQENSIDFSDLYGSISEGKYFTHNHPSSGIFSNADISTNSYFKFAEFTAVTKSGKKYTIIRTAGSVDNISVAQITMVRQNISSQLQAQYAQQLSELTPGSPEFQELQTFILEEWDRLTLSHFGYDHLIQ